MMVTGFPVFFINSDVRSDYYKNFTELANGLTAVLRIYSSAKADMDSLGWKKEDGDRWAIIGNDLRVVEQGEGMPDPDVLESIFSRNNIRGEVGTRRAYISEYGSQPGLELDLALTTISSIDGSLNASERDQTGSPMSANGNDDPFAEAARSLNRLVNDHPGLMMNLFYHEYSRSSQIAKSQSMQMASGRMLPNLEILLERKPSSGVLWNQWLYWRRIQGADRPIEPLIERIKTSPASKAGTVPPPEVFGAYYDECIREGKWDKVIKLLRTVWDREFTRVIDLQKENPDFRLSQVAAERYPSGSLDEIRAYLVRQNSAALGDRVGVPLIEACLKDNKAGDASEIFDAWLNCGGKFADFTKTIGLAREKGQEMLAREWEGKIGDVGNNPL
jgi:hypothetical protein